MYTCIVDCKEETHYWRHVTFTAVLHKTCTAVGINKIQNYLHKNNTMPEKEKLCKETDNRLSDFTAYVTIHKT